MHFDLVNTHCDKSIIFWVWRVSDVLQDLCSGQQYYVDSHCQFAVKQLGCPKWNAHKLVHRSGAVYSLQ